MGGRDRSAEKASRKARGVGHGGDTRRFFGLWQDVVADDYV